MSKLSKHRCPWPGCTVMVDHDLWGCKTHWYKVPPELRRALWHAYKKGQTVWTLSQEYIDAASAIQRWIEAYMARPDNTPTMRGGNHGWVTPRADGRKARCGGPGVCRACAAELRAQAKLDERQGDLPL